MKNKYLGLDVMLHKEIREHLRSKRFNIMLILIFIIGLSSIYSSSMGIRDALKDSTNSEFVFLRLFSTSGGSIPSFTSFIGLLGPLIGLALGFDLMNGETAKGTLSRLLSQPIYRDTVIIGKFLGGAAILGIMCITLFTAVSALSIIIIGIPPTADELIRLIIFLIITIIYMSLWYAISLMLSMVFKQTATSALAGIALWLFLAIFVTLISGIVADAIYPVNSQSSIEAMFKNQSLKLNMTRISPMNIYSEAITTILNPGVRSIGLIFTNQLEGAIPGTLPVGQSLLLIWAHIITLITMITICFAVSYVRFMRREIRSN